MSLASKLRGSLATLVAFAAVASAANAFATTDSFESYGGTSGVSLSTSPYTGPLGTWKDTSNASTPNANNETVIITGDSTAYDGKNYLQMIDNTNVSVQSSSALTLSSPIAMAGKTFTISFALRDEGTTAASLDQNQVVIYGSSQANANIAFQAGIKAGGQISYTTFSNGIATNGAVSSTYTAKAGDWYLFTLTYSVAGTTTFTGTANLTITDTSSSPSFTGSFNSGNVASGTFSTAALATLTYVGTQTSASGTGNADFDDLTIVTPEPASCGVIGISGAAIMLKRRRRTGTV